MKTRSCDKVTKEEHRSRWLNTAGVGLDGCVCTRLCSTLTPGPARSLVEIANANGLKLIYQIKKTVRRRRVLICDRWCYWKAVL